MNTSKPPPTIPVDYQAQQIARANAQRAADRPKKIAIYIGSISGVALIGGSIAGPIGFVMGGVLGAFAPGFIIPRLFGGWGG
jgi:hypothetical protein